MKVGFPTTSPITEKLQTLGEKFSMLGSINEAMGSSGFSFAWIGSGTLSDRPDPGVTGRLFVKTDAPIHLYFDDGASWITIV